MTRAIILTYHSVGPGPSPLCIDPELFERHAQSIATSGAEALTVVALAERIREGRLSERAVAITFDDGFADTVDVAAPILRAYGLPATVFCVSGYLGRTNDWPSQPAGVPRRPLATAEQLNSLVAEGWEIGAHGVDHAPLDALSHEGAREQMGRSRVDLETMLGISVRSFAFPYGSIPKDASAMLREAGLDAACTTIVASIRADPDPLRLPRVDAHYVRRPTLLVRTLHGGRSYLALRRAGALARRIAP